MKVKRIGITCLIASILLVGCSQKTSQDSSKDNENKPVEVKFDQSKIDIELFNHLSSDGVDSNLSSQAMTMSTNLFQLFRLTRFEIFNQTDYIDIVSTKYALEIILMNPDMTSSNVTEGTYTFTMPDGTKTDIPAPLAYYPLTEVQLEAQRLFGNELNTQEIQAMTNIYNAELEGFVNWGVGGMFEDDVDNQLTVKVYQDMYVVISDYHVVDHTTKETKSKGQLYVVLEKVSDKEGERLVYRWAYHELIK